jgi:hypothetical protein
MNPAKASTKLSARLAHARTRKAITALLVTAAISVVLGAVALPTLIVLGVGMIPALVAFAADDTPNYTVFQTVAPLNFAGVIPSIFSLWEHGQTIQGAYGEVSNVFNLMTMYGGAGIGWMLTFMMPQFARTLVDSIIKVQLQRLALREKAISDDWDFREN